MIEKNKITQFLLSFFLLCFFVNSYSQIHIAEATVFYVEKNAVITGDIKVTPAEPKDLLQSSASKKSKKLIAQVAKLKQQKKKTASKQLTQKSDSGDAIWLAYQWKKGNSHYFTASDSGKRPVIPPDQHWKFELYALPCIFISNYFYKEERNFYKILFLHNRNGGNSRTRPPPFMLS